MEYLIIELFLTLAFLLLSKILNKSKEILIWRYVKVAVITGALFMFWDYYAIKNGHWYFGKNYLIGYFIGNIPIEEIYFGFVLAPIAALIVWTYLKRKRKLTK